MRVPVARQVAAIPVGCRGNGFVGFVGCRGKVKSNSSPRDLLIPGDRRCMLTEDERSGDGRRTNGPEHGPLLADMRTKGERRLRAGWCHAAKPVHLCVLADRPCVPIDPGHADTWGAERQVAADVLRELLLKRARQGCEVDPVEMHLHGARITGQLDLSWARLGFAVALIDCSFEQPFRAEHAELAGLDLSGSHLPELVAIGLTTRGRILLDRMDCPGGAILTEARVDGSLHARQATMGRSDHEPGHEALNLDLAAVEGEVDLTDTKTQGEVRLIGARIGGQFICRNCNFSNRNGNALVADGARLAGGIFLHEGFRAEGQVRLVAASIGRQLVCRNGSFANPDGYALTASTAQINGNVFLDNEFKAEGEVGLVGASIGGQVKCGGGNFSNQTSKDAHTPVALNLQRVRAGTRLELTPKTVKGVVDLTDTKVATLCDSKESWPKQLRLDGFSYLRIEKDYGKNDPSSAEREISAKDRCDWVARHVEANGEPGFAPRAYEQLIATYRATGDDSAARTVAIARDRHRHKLLTKQSSSPPVWGRRAGSRFLAMTVRYGHQPWLAAIWLVGAWFALWALVSLALGVDAIGPLTQDPPELVPVMYALDTVVPIVNFGQRDHWFVEAPYAWAVWAAIALGWLLVTALVAGLSNVFRHS